MSDITPDHLNEVYAFAVQLGKDAGEMLMTAARKRFESHAGASTSVSYVEKDSSVDIVTKTDNGKLRRRKSPVNPIKLLQMWRPLFTSRS